MNATRIHEASALLHELAGTPTPEQSLDKVYHAIPEWVHRLYPNKSLDEKVALGFEYQQKTWTETFMREVQEHRKISRFLIFLMKKHGFDWATEYWAFLTAEDEERNRQLPKS